MTPLFPDEQLVGAEAEFLADFPAYRETAQLDDLRRVEYTRLDEQKHIYLDYTGGGLYAQSQITEHMTRLLHNIYGNPHSENPTSLAATELVERTRRAVLDFFQVTPDQYIVIFTPNASGALKLVGEAYPFAPGCTYALSVDDHNSVNGIREFARARGARVVYAPLIAPELRLDTTRLEAILDETDPAADNLFAFPAQSNFSGVKHPLTLITQAREQGFDVLLDCAAYVPTNPLDLGRWLPDFAVLSFYKMFGYPTGLGALLARPEALRKLRRPWFAGGTVDVVTVKGDSHYLAENETGFEDGTVDYLNIPAVEIGLNHLRGIGMERIQTRVRCLTSWVIDQLVALRHENGRPVCAIHGPTNTQMRGGTITVTFLDPAGAPISGNKVEKMAAQRNISLRTGCFCNPGAGETAFGLDEAYMKQKFAARGHLPFEQLAAEIRAERGVDVSAVRVSLGLVTNFADVYRFMQFAAGIADQYIIDSRD